MKTINAERGRGKNLAGAICTEGGLITRVRIGMRHGRRTVESVESWPMSNVPQTTLRLSGGAVLGVRAQWRRGAPDAALEAPAFGANADINPYSHAAEFDFFLDALSGCVTRAVAEDSFLLTLPLAFCDNPADSFLSIYSEGAVVTIGVAIDRKLEAVFSFPNGGASSAEASAARVRRYWSHVLKRDDFPRRAFIFDSAAQAGDCDGLSAEPLALPEKLNGGGAIRAAGAALAALYPAPAFRLPPQYAFRARRPLLLKIAATLVCLSLTAALAAFLLNAHAGKKLAHSEEVYHTRLNENNALRELNKTADGLSAKILAAQKAFAQTTNWGNLLLLLGEIKPDDLFLDRLGSDNVQYGAENSVRIAMSGWAKTETSVTEFISALQASDYISGASLSSMERDAKDKNFCRFRIICTMRLFKN